MRSRYIILFLLINHGFLITAFPQVTQTTEQQLENLTDAAQSETEDDSYLQQLDQFRKNPVNLNTADENELKELKILTDLQIANLISYKKIFNKTFYR